MIIRKRKKRSHASTEAHKKKISIIEYFVSALVVAIVTTMIAMMISNYKSIQNDYEKLRDLADNMSTNSENIYRFCRTAVSDPNNPTEFQQWVLLSYQKDNSDNIVQYNTIRRSLGMLTSKEVNAQLHELSCFTDVINSLNTKACLVEVPENKSVPLRNKTIIAIEKEIREHESIRQIIVDLLMNYIDNPRDKSPEALPCPKPTIQNLSSKNEGANEVNRKNQFPIQLLWLNTSTNLTL